MDGNIISCFSSGFILAIFLIIIVFFYVFKLQTATWIEESVGNIISYEEMNLPDGSVYSILKGTGLEFFISFDTFCIRLHLSSSYSLPMESPKRKAPDARRNAVETEMDGDHFKMDANPSKFSKGITITRINRILATKVAKNINPRER